MRLRAAPPPSRAPQHSARSRGAHNAQLRPIVVTVLLILSASAIAAAPASPMRLAGAPHELARSAAAAARAAALRAIARRAQRTYQLDRRDRLVDFLRLSDRRSTRSFNRVPWRPPLHVSLRAAPPPSRAPQHSARSRGAHNAQLRSIVVTVLLILSASAIAAAPAGQIPRPGAPRMSFRRRGHTPRNAPVSSMFVNDSSWSSARMRRSAASKCACAMTDG